MIDPVEAATDTVLGRIRPNGLSVLLVEDSLRGVPLVAECLGERLGDGFMLDSVETLGEALAHLQRVEYDVALVDLHLPDSAGVDTFEALCGTAPSLPLIVLAGLEDEEAALDCIRAGAQDYVIKGQHDAEVLIRTMRFAI